MRVCSSHGVDELASHPFPGQVPVVESAERVEVVHGYLGLVVAFVGLEHVVREGEVAVLPRHELRFRHFGLEFWVLVTTYVHCVGCKKEENLSYY